LGLDEDSLEDSFGSHFRDGARVLTLDADELQSAIAAHPSEEDGPLQDVVLEHGSVMHVHLGSVAAVNALSASKRQELTDDLAVFSERAGVRAELYIADGAASANIVLTGVPEEIVQARQELNRLLKHYGLGPGAVATTATAAERAETLEVEGMKMQSLPPRNRRRRKAREDDDVSEEPTEKRPVHDDTARACAGSVGEDSCGEKDPTQMGPSSAEVGQYEFMDHTADVILHSWGRDMKEAWEQVCVCFFAYMTELEKVEMKATVEVEASGHDILDLLYHLLDEFLFSFGSEFIICRRIELLELDTENLRARARGYGERFDLAKHPQGTEIKAITMHQMKVLTPETLTAEDGTMPRKESEKEGGKVREGFPYECYVLVDI